MDNINSYYSRALSDLRYAEYGLEVGRKYGDFKSMVTLIMLRSYDRKLVKNF